ncbi:MAG: hypothetical protein ABIE25_05605 [Thermoplasmatota archaeon]|nr:hypothetical protein [Candidatus Thermoplasmatota archaeon]MBU1914525.1 hypothetical protein [Candidatus Thermoplasmatota archaeon]
MAMKCPKCGREVPNVILAIVAFVIVALVVGVYFASTNIGHPSRFTATIEYEAGSDRVDVWGRIYNNRSSDAVAIVLFSIFDGASWHQYDFNAGLVHGNSFTYFRWVAPLHVVDPNSVNVQFRIIEG